MKKLIRLCLSASIVCLAFNALAYTTSYYAASSKLAQGHWVKIEIDTTGIFEISHQHLHSLGFSDPSAVKVYGYGGVVATEQAFTTDYPDDIIPTASMHTADGRLLFYGEGDVRGSFSSTSATHNQTATFKRNYYDNKAYYFLSDIADGAAMTTNPSGTSDDAHDWSYCIDLIEHETQNPAKGGAFFHGPLLKAGEKEDFTFHIRDFREGTGIAKGYFYYKAAVLPPERKTVTIPITPSDNLYILTNSPSVSSSNSTETSYYVEARGRATFDTSEQAPLDDAHVTFSLTIPATFAGTYAAIDYAYITYARSNNLSERSDMVMYYDPNQCKAFKITGAEPATEVWNVGNPKAYSRYEMSYNPDESSATGCLTADEAAGATRLIAFNPSAPHRAVKIVGTVPNQNLHAEQAPDMLIVTTPELYAAACELADIHRREQGFDVLVVRQDEAFNEFSSGCKHPGAIRRLAKRFHDTAPDKFRYLLLYGYTSYDPRGITHDSSKELICYEVENEAQARESVTSYCADQYFGMLEDDYVHTSIYRMPMSVSVGRVPVENAAMAKLFNGKMQRYFAEPPTVQNYTRALFTSDRGNDNAHLYQANDAAIAASAKNAALTTMRADNLVFNEDDSEMTRYIERCLYNGVGFFNYCGHGMENELSGAAYYHRNVQQYSYRSWPVAMLSTCNAFPLDYFKGDIASAMLFKEDGGAIGAIGACRSVYLEHNHHINKAVAEAYASATVGTCTGDLLRQARNTMIANNMQSSLGYNTLCYNLCGDPAMPLPAPDYTITIEGIGDDNLTDDGEGLPSGSTTRLRASITDAAGNPVESFNGTGAIDIFDTPVGRDFTRTRPNGAVETTRITIDDNPLASIPVKIVNGKVDAEITLPAPTTTGSNRIVLTATDAENGLTAAGTFKGLSITSDGNAGDIDTSAPEIEKMYIGTPEFEPGGCTAPTFTFFAIVNPSASGINNSPKGLSPTRLTLDGNTSFANTATAFRFDEDGKARLELKIKDLPDGPHTFELVVANTSGTRASAKLDFTVLSAPVQGTLSVGDGNPVRTSATFSLETTDTELSTTRLVITDSRGNTVLSKSGVAFPYTWELTGNDGETVPDGFYKAHVIFSTPTAYGSTGAIEFVVLK